MYSVDVEEKLFRTIPILTVRSTLISSDELAGSITSTSERVLPENREQLDRGIVTRTRVPAGRPSGTRNRQALSQWGPVNTTNHFSILSNPPWPHRWKSYGRWFYSGYLGQGPDLRSRLEPQPRFARHREKLYVEESRRETVDDTIRLRFLWIKIRNSRIF